MTYLGLSSLQTVFQKLDGDEPLYLGAFSRIGKCSATCVNAFKLATLFALTPGRLGARRT